MNEQQARDYCAKRLAPEAIRQLEHFRALLIDENQRQNLVSRETLHTPWSRHFADSLQLVDFGPTRPATWLDVGSGAGFPGIVLAIAQPDASFTLVEQRRRRAAWLSFVVGELALQNVSVAHNKVESIALDSYDVITARALASLPEIILACRHLSHRDTLWILPKGNSAGEEVSQLPKSDLRFHVEPSITRVGAGILIGKRVKPGDYDRGCQSKGRGR